MLNTPQARTAQKFREMAMRNRVHYLTNGHAAPYSDDFYTPDSLVQALGAFDLDPCAGPKSHARRNIRLPQDGLKARWYGRVWLNPPYSNIHIWLQRFVAHGDGIALVNARCETVWFQALAGGADGLLFLRRRVNFERPDRKPGHPPVGSVLVAYGRENRIALEASRLPGVLVMPPH